MAAVCATAALDSSQDGTVVEKLPRGARRRHAKQVLEAKLSAAHNCIRKLELQIVTAASTSSDSSAVDELTAINSEVNSRFAMARPTLTSLVAAGRAGIKPSVNGDMRATRNFALHADLGCGSQALPCNGAEAKRRIRGGKSLRDDVSCAHPAELHQFQDDLHDCSDPHQDSLPASLEKRLRALELDAVSCQGTDSAAARIATIEQRLYLLQSRAETVENHPPGLISAHTAYTEHSGNDNIVEDIRLAALRNLLVSARGDTAPGNWQDQSSDRSQVAVERLIDYLQPQRLSTTSRSYESERLNQAPFIECSARFSVPDEHDEQAEDSFAQPAAVFADDLSGHAHGSIDTTAFFIGDVDATVQTESIVDSRACATQTHAVERCEIGIQCNFSGLQPQVSHATPVTLEQSIEKPGKENLVDEADVGDSDAEANCSSLEHLANVHVFNRFACFASLGNSDVGDNPVTCLRSASRGQPVTNTGRTLARQATQPAKHVNATGVCDYGNDLDEDPSLGPPTDVKEASQSIAEAQHEREGVDDALQRLVARCNLHLHQSPNYQLELDELQKLRYDIVEYATLHPSVRDACMRLIAAVRGL